MLRHLVMPSNVSLRPSLEQIFEETSEWGPSKKQIQGPSSTWSGKRFSWRKVENPVDLTSKVF